MKLFLPLPGYKHSEELQSELVWVQNKRRRKEEEALVLMSFLFQIITWLNQHFCWHTGEGADRIAIFFGYSAEEFGGQQHKPAQWQS